MSHEPRDPNKQKKVELNAEQQGVADQVRNLLNTLPEAERAIVLTRLSQELAESALGKDNEPAVEMAPNEKVEAFLAEQHASIAPGEVVALLRNSASNGRELSVEAAKAEILKHLIGQDPARETDVNTGDYVQYKRKAVEALRPLYQPDKFLPAITSPLERTVRNGLLPILADQLTTRGLHSAFIDDVRHRRDDWKIKQNIQRSADIMLDTLAGKLGFQHTADANVKIDTEFRTDKPYEIARYVGEEFLPSWYNTDGTIHECMQYAGGRSEASDKVEINRYVRDRLWAFQCMRVIGSDARVAKLFPKLDVAKLDAFMKEHYFTVQEDGYQRRRTVGTDNERQADVDVIEAKLLHQQLEPFIQSLVRVIPEKEKFEVQERLKAFKERREEFGVLAMIYEREFQALAALDKQLKEANTRLGEKTWGVFNKLSGDARKDLELTLPSIQRQRDEQQTRLDRLAPNLLKFKDIFSGKSDDELLSMAADWTREQVLLNETGATALEAYRLGK